MLLRQGIILGFLVSGVCLCHAWKKASRSDQFAKVDSTLNGTLDIAGMALLVGVLATIVKVRKFLRPWGIGMVNHSTGAGELGDTSRGKKLPEPRWLSRGGRIESRFGKKRHKRKTHTQQKTGSSPLALILASFVLRRPFV